MFDILLYLFESYFDIGSYPDHDKLSVKLSAAGFEEDDINQALTWLSGLQQLTRAAYPDSINFSGTRLYTDFESQRISPEGLRFLAFWEHNKLITPIEREMIIDRVLALGRKNLSLDKLKLIVLMVLWSQHEDLDPMIIEDLLTPADSAQLH
ncbi:protein Smg [mine drainage metagenome]|uniref:Protein Smg n=1 Tax=mine drainage metagenome TaxID=410659 RepID=A0A1J5T7V2_9ZZZZ